MAAHFLTPVLLQNILYRNIQSIHIISGTTEINDRLDRTSFYNPKSSGRSGVRGFWGAGQGATTRNGYSIPRSCNAAMCRKKHAIRPVANSPKR
jgi:hypothetical protein